MPDINALPGMRAETHLVSLQFDFRYYSTRPYAFLQTAPNIEAKSA